MSADRPLLPSERGRGCRPTGDNRPYFKGMVWMARTGTQWRHLPDRYGKWNSLFWRYRRWVVTSMFEAMLKTFAAVVERDTSADMINSTVVRAHHCAVKLKKRDQEFEGLGRSRGGFTTKLHARCDGWRSLCFVLTAGQAHDVKGLGPLFGMLADRIEALLAYKGQDADAICQELAKADVKAIPIKSNYRIPIPRDRERFSWRNLVEHLSKMPIAGAVSRRVTARL